MYTNNLNGAYEYESERRADELRAAAESQLMREVGSKRGLTFPSPAVLVITVALIGVLAWVF